MSPSCTVYPVLRMDRVIKCPVCHEDTDVHERSYDMVRLSLESEDLSTVTSPTPVRDAIRPSRLTQGW